MIEPGDRNFYRPALLWGLAAGVATFLTEYLGNDAALESALMWAGVGAITAGLLFARLLTAGDRPRRRPRAYRGDRQS